VHVRNFLVYNCQRKTYQSIRVRRSTCDGSRKLHGPWSNTGQCYQRALHSNSIDSDPLLEQHDITALISGLFKKTNEEYFKKYFLYFSIKHKNIYISKLLCFTEKLRNTSISVNAAIKRDDFFLQKARFSTSIYEADKQCRSPSKNILFFFYKHFFDIIAATYKTTKSVTQSQYNGTHLKGFRKKRTKNLSLLSTHLPLPLPAVTDFVHMLLCLTVVAHPFIFFFNTFTGFSYVFCIYK
jgi:hypothetical protein